MREYCDHRKKECGKEKQCVYYNHEALGWKISVICAVAAVIGVLAVIAAIIGHIRMSARARGSAASVRELKKGGTKRGSTIEKKRGSTVEKKGSTVEKKRGSTVEKPGAKRGSTIEKRKK